MFANLKALPPEFLVFAIIVLGGCVLLAAVGDFLLRRRRKSVAKSANELGLAVYRDEQELMEKEGWHLSGLTHGNGMLLQGEILSHEFSNIMYAENDGLAVFVFDHKYDHVIEQTLVPIPGKRQTVVLIVSPEVDVQKFKISVELMANEGFYEDFAKGLFDFFDQHPKTTVEGKNQCIATYEAGKRFRPSEYATLVGRGFEVYQILKTSFAAEPKDTNLRQPVLSQQ